MQLVGIFDNGGQTLDRYTFFIDTGSPREKIAVFGASERPFHPQGFGQFCHDGWTRADVDSFRRESGDAEITADALPEQARQYLDQLLTQEDQQ